jgi:transposase
METVSVATAAPVFIPVELPAPTPAPAAAVPAPMSAPEVAQEIHIELRRGAVTVNVRWPMQAAAQCAAWLREILR